MHAGSPEGIASNVLADRLKRLSALQVEGECSTTCSSPSTEERLRERLLHYANIVHDALSASTPSNQDNLDRAFGVPAKALSRVPKGIMPTQDASVLWVRVEGQPPRPIYLAGDPVEILAELEDPVAL